MTTTIPDPRPTEADPAPDTTTAAAPSATIMIRRLALRLHFFVGILVAPFLAVLCLTGIAYVFAPQIDNLAYHDDYFVDSHSGPAHPLADQVKAALAASPGAKLTSVVTPDADDRTTAVVLSAPGLASGYARTVYVNPYTATVQGVLTTDSGRPPLAQWLRDLHGNLQLGTLGRLYSETAASWLPFLVLGGLILWIGRRRKRKVRDLVIPESGLKAGRPRLRNRHAVLGSWLAIGLLAISVTGLTWSNYAGARFEALVTALNGRTPSLSAVVPPRPAGTPTIGIDQALAAGRQAGLVGSLTVAPPKKSGAAYTVAESFQTLPVRSDSVAVDPHSGAVVGQLHFADYPLAAKLTTLGILLHSGTLFGLANQIGMALLALGTLVMIVLGYRMWWQRRPKRASQRIRLAPPPAKPIWSQLSKPVLLLAVVVTAAVGWALPVLGGTLVLFLVVELGLYAARRPWLTRQPVG